MFPETAMVIRDLCGEITGKRILNIGSSTEHFYKHSQPHIWLKLLEPLQKMGNVVINLDIKKGTGVDIVADCQDMSDIPDHSYDIVLCCSVLEHVVDPAKVLAEIHRVVKPDPVGFIILSMPGVYSEHPDPIDTGLRMKTRYDWFRFLGSSLSGQPFVYARTEARSDRTYATVVQYSTRCKLTVIVPIRNYTTFDYENKRYELFPRFVRCLEQAIVSLSDIELVIVDCGSDNYPKYKYYYDYGASGTTSHFDFIGTKRSHLVRLGGLPLCRARANNQAANSVSSGVLFFTQPDMLISSGVLVRACEVAYEKKIFIPPYRRFTSEDEVKWDWEDGSGNIGMLKSTFDEVGPWPEAKEGQGTLEGEADGPFYYRNQDSLYTHRLRDAVGNGRLVRERTEGLRHMWHPKPLRVKKENE